MTGAEIKNKLGNIEAATITALAYTVLVAFHGRTIEVKYHSERDQYTFATSGSVAGYFHHDPNSVKAAIQRRIAGIEARAKAFAESEGLTFNEAMEYTTY